MRNECPPATIEFQVYPIVGYVKTRSIMIGLRVFSELLGQ